MSCPFKIIGHKAIIDYFTETENVIAAGNRGAIYGEPKDACDLRNYKECVGEDICPIMKKITIIEAMDVHTVGTMNLNFDHVKRVVTISLIDDHCNITLKHDVDYDDWKELYEEI